jgi:hypothetical protein
VNLFEVENVDSLWLIFFCDLNLMIREAASESTMSIKAGRFIRT